MQFRRWSERLTRARAGSLSLPFAVVLPFTIQTLVVVGLIGYLSYRAGERTVLSLVNQLMMEAGDRVSLYIDFANAQTLQGSVAIDQLSQGMSTYLQQNPIGDSGTLLIVNQQGQILASSIDNGFEILGVPNQSDASALAPSTLFTVEIPLIQAAGQALYPQLASPEGMGSTGEGVESEASNANLQDAPESVLKPIRFGFEGNRYFARSLTLKEESGLDWLMVAIVPAAEFSGSFRANVLRTLILGALAALSSVAIGVCIARRMMSPLQKLNRTTQALAQENFDAVAPLDSVAQRSDGIGQLAQSFHQMAEQLKHTIQSLKNEQQRLSKFLDAMPLGVLIHHADKSVFYINRAGRVLIGAKGSTLSHENAFATPCQICHTETQQPYPEQALPPVRALQGEEAVVDDVAVHREDGMVSLEVRAVPVLAADGTVEYAITVFQDITERKRKERLLNRYNRDLNDQVTKNVSQLDQERQKLQAVECDLQKVREELDYLSKVDDLTQISNRRRFSERLMEEWQRQTRSQVPLSLIMIEIDQFQAYKDTYGQQQSDRCLVLLARSLNQSIKRPADVVARYGAEEFAAILPETDLKGALVVVKRMQWIVQRLNIPHQASSVSSIVTVSLGVATTVPALGMMQNTLMTEASRMLYRAKSTGGDRCEAIEFGHQSSSSEL